MMTRSYKRIPSRYTKRRVDMQHKVKVLMPMFLLGNGHTIICAKNMIVNNNECMCRKNITM